MQPDVEALLVNRVGGRRLYYLAPIDVCFELVGLMRTIGAAFPAARKSGAKSTPSSTGSRPAPAMVPNRRRSIMPDLDFKVTGLEPAVRGLAPLLSFQVEITNTPAEETIHSVMLQAQIQLQVTQRRYTAEEKEKLAELFGPPERWRDTLRTKLWAIAQTIVPAFTGSTTATLTIPCTFDLNVAATKYFYALDDGDVPLLFLFSGTIFYEAADGRLQVQQISWKKECAYKMPVQRLAGT